MQTARTDASLDVIARRATVTPSAIRIAGNHDQAARELRLDIDEVGYLERLRQSRADEADRGAYGATCRHSG